MSEAAEKLLRRAAQARRENRLVDAKRDLDEALHLCRQAGAGMVLAQTLTALGQIERDLEHSDAAREHCAEAVAIYRKQDTPLRLAHAVRHLGDVHQEAGHPGLAEPCYDEALALYRSHEATPALDLANAIRSLAVLKDQAGANQEARRLWEEARDLYEAVNVKQGVAGSSARLALLAWRRGDAEGARRWLAEACSAAEASGDPHSLRYVQGIRAQIEG